MPLTTHYKNSIQQNIGTQNKNPTTMQYDKITYKTSDCA